MSIFRANLVPLLHSLASFLLFVGLSAYFLYFHPTPDYNDLLSVLIGALVTIVSVMFSAVLVALQLASAQFSPRITRAFFQENRPVQTAFYLFLFGIAFSMAIKFTYSTTAGAFQYPVLPVVGAVFGFFLISFVLPRFVFYIAGAINAATIARNIATRTISEIDTLYGTAPWQTGDPETFAFARLQTPCHRTTAVQFGLLDRIRHHKISNLAKTYPHLRFHVQVMVGNFVTPGETLVKLESTDPTQPHPPQLDEALRACFVLSQYRSYNQDVLFGVRQLTDMAIKAISPAVNDPTTCVNCLHYLAVIVRRFAQGNQCSHWVRQAPPNLLYREFTFDILVDQAFDQIYQWGKHDPVVVSQLLNAMTDVAKDLQNPHCKAVLSKQLRDFELEKLSFDLVEHQAKVKRYAEKAWAVLG